MVIGASTIPGTYLLPRLAAAFKQEYPEISFEIRIKDTATIVDLVANNELFVGVVGAKLQTTKVHFQAIAKDELILAAAYNNPIEASISLNQLAELPFITREQGSGTLKSTELFLIEGSFPPNKLNICATLGSSAAVKEAIKADLGLSILSKMAVEDELRNKTIKHVHIDSVEMKRKFYLVTHTKRSLPNNYQQLIRRFLHQ
ncbi:MAG: hypothetical protein GY702_18595 [Desulfobulbaceae bacterium]|nr:hypothetical protein [Desulfobulbaceae bacterium]